MRLNEFQAHIVRSEPISGFIDQEIVEAIERSVADMLVAAARLAQSAGTDLDSIAYAAVQKLPVASVSTGNISEKQES
jgi:hypothetical protein